MYVRPGSNDFKRFDINIVYCIPQNWKLRSGQWVSEDYQDISIYDIKIYKRYIIIYTYMYIQIIQDQSICR